MLRPNRSNGSPIPQQPNWGLGESSPQWGVGSLPPQARVSYKYTYGDHDVEKSDDRVSPEQQSSIGTGRQDMIDDIREALMALDCVHDVIIDDHISYVHGFVFLNDHTLDNRYKVVDMGADLSERYNTRMDLRVRTKEEEASCKMEMMG